MELAGVLVPILRVKSLASLISTKAKRAASGTKNTSLQQTILLGCIGVVKVVLH